MRFRRCRDAGAIDTVVPRSIAKTFTMKETAVQERRRVIAANESKIRINGLRGITGYADDGERISMRM